MKSAAPTCAVFFDGDGTLWDFDRVMRASLAQTCQDIKDRHPDITVTVDDLIADRAAVAVRYPVATPMEVLRTEGFRHTLARLGISDDRWLTSVVENFFARRFGQTAVYPDVVDCLARLREDGYFLGFLSNGNSAPARSGLPDVFDVELFSAQLGLAKPDPAIYRQAATTVPETITTLVMVGDSLSNDVAAAQQARWQAVWLNREGNSHDHNTPDHDISDNNIPDHNPGSVAPDAEINSLAALPPLLPRLLGDEPGVHSG